MIGRAVLSEEHRELDALAKRILVEIAGDGPSVELSSLRWRLNRVLTKHLALEDQLLYPILRANPVTASLAEQVLTEVGGTAATYAAYHAAWPIERIQEDWEAFRAATRDVMTLVRRRILREERDLFPRASWPGADGR
ncbi:MULTISPECIES: hemerythrin domain-containing protein [Sphingomonas]|uniref:hemerythrin domain-containing protein n=1 Tax=Sphingomonas TaxID=13687 RepID=UPI001AE5A5F5